MICFQGVSRSYGDNVAVRQLDLEIGTGELFALLGHNGAGKTTTIKMLVGLLRPGSGAVTINGADVVEQTRQAVQQIGYVPDQPYLYDKLSGREFLSFVAEMHGLSRPETRDRIDVEIERFGLAAFVDELTESYSHGMKQRTVFASAMLHHPRVLVVDEPLVGLDPHSMRLVKNLLRERAEEGVSVLMSTHTLTAAEEIADRIGIMSQGELLFCGTMDELRQQQNDPSHSLESMYLSMVTSEPRSEETPLRAGEEEGA